MKYLITNEYYLTMHFITFIYKIKNIKRTFYGKYFVDYVSDDHDGLDNEVRPTLLTGINIYRKQKGLEMLNSSDLQIGILSFSLNGDISPYSSDNEIECFDFYYESEQSTNKCIDDMYYGRLSPARIFINGMKLEE